MKSHTSFKWFALALIFIMALGIVAPAAPVAADSIGTNEQTRVWVQFDPGSKGQIQAALNESKATVHYEFDELNAIVVSLPVQAIEGLAKNPNVIAIEEDAPRYLSAQETPYGIDLIQAREIWDANHDGTIDTGAPTGSGIKVCIIDSGLFTGHEDLAGVNVLGGYPSNWNTDTCGHGTHVAGTIAAANNALGVVGVTPGATSLYIVKVFGDDCAWTYSSTLVDASNRCAAAGADIISMSLGGPTYSSQENTAFQTHYNNGILSIAAAGNEGTTATSYPAGYASVVSVAAVDSSKLVADFSQKNADVEIAAPGVAVKSTIPYIATSTIAVSGVTYAGHPVEYATETTASGSLVDGGLCGSTSTAFSGKVVLCQRGTNSFYDKVHNVQLSGGVAAVIYNNTTGDLLATLGEGYSSTIPAIGITLADGAFLVANRLGQSAVVTNTVAWNVSGYEAWDGTSMATPHVSGAAALIWSANPAWTNAQIRSAITATAQDLGTSGRDTSYGFGLIQPKAALTYLQGAPPTGALVVTATTNKTSYITRETVTMTVTVKDANGAAVSGAAVTGVLTTFNGKKINYAGTTNTSGTVTFTHKVAAAKYGKGTYTLVATATKSGYTQGTGSVSFTVTK